MFLWPLTSRFVSISRDVLSIKFSAVNRVTNLVSKQCVIVFVHKRGEWGSTSSLYVPNCHFFEFLVSHDAEVASFLIDWIPPPVLVSLWCGDWMYKWKVHICNLQRPVFHLLQLSCLKDFWLADAMMPPFSYFT